MTLHDSGNVRLDRVTHSSNYNPRRSAPVVLSRRAVLSGAAAGLSLSLLRGSLHAATSRSAIARTRSGTVRGLFEDSVYSFKGVRYGADTSARRFMPPLAPASWSHTADALQYGASA